MGRAGKILKKIFWIFLLLIFLMGLSLIVLFTLLDVFDEDESHVSNQKSELINKLRKDSAMIKAATSDYDTTVQVIRVSAKENLDTHFGIDEEAGKQKRIFTGRRINVAVIGVDSRLNTSYKHADANHVVSFLIDNGKIEITAIPRDTPCDAGQEDSAQNKLTVLYPARGKRAYLEEVATIAELDRIHYYVEVGFSQAKGILELLGFKNSGSALQVLRSRSVLGGNDYQRCYNQAQFIRQMFLKHFEKLTGFFSEILIRGGLTLVNTNMTYPIVKNIFDKLERKGFPGSPNDIVIRIRPPLNIKYKIYDYSDKNVMTNLTDKVESYTVSSSSSYYGDRHRRYKVSDVLWNKINAALLDSAERPWEVIAGLKTLFNQRAWLQMEDVKERDSIREIFAVLLYDAYLKRNQANKAREVMKIIESEKKLFSIPVFNKSVPRDTSDSNNFHY
ncbi:hypothetical protein ACFLSQ_09705 [Bacteroidota bacterium]